MKCGGKQSYHYCLFVEGLGSRALGRRKRSCNSLILINFPGDSGVGNDKEDAAETIFTYTNGKLLNSILLLVELPSLL